MKSSAESETTMPCPKCGREIMVPADVTCLRQWLRRALWYLLLPIDLCAALLAAALYIVQIISPILATLIHVWTIWMSWDISKNFLHQSTWSAISNTVITAATPVISEAIFVYKIGLNTLYGLAVVVAVLGYFGLFGFTMFAPMAYLGFRYIALRDIKTFPGLKKQFPRPPEN